MSLPLRVILFVIEENLPEQTIEMIETDTSRRSMIGEMRCSLELMFEIFARSTYILNCNFRFLSCLPVKANYSYKNCIVSSVR